MVTESWSSHGYIWHLGYGFRLKNVRCATKDIQATMTEIQTHSGVHVLVEVLEIKNLD